MKKNSEVNNFDPKLIQVAYTENGLFGFAKIPYDNCFYCVRVTLFQPDGKYFVMTEPVMRNGSFCIQMQCDVEHVTVGLVDRPYAFYPGTYTLYDSVEFDCKEAEKPTSMNTL